MTTWDPMDLATPDMVRLSEVFDLSDAEDSALLRDLLQTVLEDGPGLLAELADLARAEGSAASPSGLREAARALRNTLANVGYSHASQLCARIVDAAGEGDSEAALELCTALEKGSDCLIQGIQDFQDQL